MQLYSDDTYTGKRWKAWMPNKLIISILSSWREHGQVLYLQYWPNGIGQVVPAEVDGSGAVLDGLEEG